MTRPDLTPIRLGNDCIALAQPQIDLLLFFDDRGEAPRRVVQCHYAALLTHGLIETYLRRPNATSPTYRITERGQHVAALLLPRGDRPGRQPNSSGTSG